jgi:hypothetical protein
MTIKTAGRIKLLRQYLRKGLDVVARKGNLKAFMM